MLSKTENYRTMYLSEKLYEMVTFLKTMAFEGEVNHSPFGSLRSCIIFKPD